MHPPPSSDRPLAGIELGGTKAIALVAVGSTIREQVSLPTRWPDETLPPLAEWLAERAPDGGFGGLGLATFGPARIGRDHPDFGQIAVTPKPGWSGAALVAPFAALGCPIALDTDVNAAALAEYRWGAGQGATSLAYITLGTGLGVGLLVEGRPVHGRLHPEAGHLQWRRAPGDDFAGACPFHGDCGEGLLCGPALAARFGQPPADVPADDPRWNPVAHDFAQLLASLILTVSPQKILLGGGVGLGAPHLLAAAIERVPALLNGYFPDVDLAVLEQTIRPAGLGAQAGPMGAVALAIDAAAT